METTIRLEGEPVDSDEGALTFIGTATVLLQCGGFTLLTDPNFLHAGDHAYLGLGLRSKRLLDPAMEIADLPPLDLVVLSHHHGDHFDHIAARDLSKDVPIVTEPHSADKLKSQGFRRPIALDTWQQCTFTRGNRSLVITSTPGKHAPQPLQTFLPPVMGSLLEFTDNGRVRFRTYITGDTLLYDRLQEIPERFPNIDLCIIHLGGTRVAGIWLTMNAEQGIRALRLIKPRTAVPIHTDDYTVFKSGLDEFRAAVDAATPALDTEICYVDRGETWRFDLPMHER
jgi:L-ascorbate metabolism protein UlaG (beta-lactamase superfamily)